MIAPPHKTRRPPRRSAMILAMALVTLTVVMSLIVGMVSQALADHRQLRAERDLLQTELLADAALRRAEVQLAADADYDGETLELPSDQVVGHGVARIVITAQREEDGLLRIVVSAEYPFGAETSIRRTRAVTVQPQSPRAQE